MLSAAHEALEKQVEAFASGTETEYAFPAELSVEERKVVKNAAKKFGLSSDSFGMGAERCIHIFKRGSSSTPALKPIVYSVKNTFVDEPLDPSQPVDTPAVGPASQSMPAGAFQEHLSAEVAESLVVDALKESLEEANQEEALPAVPQGGLTTTVEDSAEVSSPRSSQGDTGSTAESDSHEINREISFKNSIKNTFLHFEETDARENADPRIIQSMPNGKFAEAIQSEKMAAAEALGRPSAVSENAEVEASSIPSTPQGSQMGYDAFHNTAGAAPATPTVQWTPSATAQDPSVSVLPPAVWNPATHICPMTPIVECSPTAAVSMPVAPMPPPGPPPCLAPGTPVVVVGLVNQPAFNGLNGAVSAFDEQCGRYNIMLEMGAGQQRMVKLKAENLALSQPPQMSQPVQPQVQTHMLPQVQPQAPNYETPGWMPAVSNAKPALKLELMV